MSDNRTATAQNLEVKDVFPVAAEIQLTKDDDVALLHSLIFPVNTCYTAATVRDNGRLQHVINSV